MAANKSKPLQLAGPPLDFSFKEIASMQDALYEVAESGCPANAPLVHVDPENPDETPTTLPLKRRPDTQLNSVAVRLGNNRLTCLEGLKEFLSHVLDKPDQLRWLDLSCNQLTNIDDILCDFPNLQVLYLHGNKMERLTDVAKLAHLPHLTKLTLHGNPIAEMPIYRLYIPAYIHTLQSLDFGCITKANRAATPMDGIPKRQEYSWNHSDKHRKLCSPTRSKRDARL